MAEKVELGYWAQMRKIYLRDYHRSFYNELRKEGRLTEHLNDVQERAVRMTKMLTERLAEKQGVTEELKMEDEQKWNGMMNNIRNQVREIIRAEVVYDLD